MLTQTFIVGELSELLRRGIEVRIVSLQTPVEPQRHEIIAHQGFDRLTIYDSANFYGKLAEFDPQLLHAHFATDPAAGARELAVRLNVPFTFTAHGYDIYYRPPPDFSARAAAAAAVVTVSTAGAHHIEKNLGVPIERIHVIPNGVDTGFFRPADPAVQAADMQAQGRHPQIIVCVARHAPVKSLDLLIDAGAILRDRKIHFLCILIGDGESRRGLEAKVARMGLHHCFEFMGTMIQREVLAWWRRASIGVLSSESEGMPMSLIEAAACAVPVVATRVGGVEELVENGVTGLLVEPGDAVGLADALERLLEDPELADRMGLAARQVVERKFSLTLQVDRLINLWENLLMGPPRREAT